MHTGWELVWFAKERTPDHIALVDDRTDRRLSYRALIDEVETVAAGLAARGIGRGTRVAIALPNGWEHCLLLLALMRISAVPAEINFRLRAGEIAELCRAADIAAAAVLPDPAIVAAVAGALPAGAPVWTLGGAAQGTEDLAGCRADASTLAPYVKPEREEMGYLFYTSGTTGLPKAAVIAHRVAEHRVVWLATHGGLLCGTHNRALGVMPLAHVIGFFGVFLTALAFNGTFFVVSEFNPAALNDLVAREKITYAFCVPTIFAAMIAAPNYAPAKMASLVEVLMGGAPIDPGMLAHMDDEWNASIRHIYGTTETMCSLFNLSPVGAPARMRPGYYSRIRIVRIGGDGPDDVVAPGEEGELIVDASVDTIFTEYLGRPDATAEKLRDGWYYTGDICRLEDDGDVTLAGRVDDMIRSGGESIHPDEIEAVLAEHETVAECTVVGVPDATWGHMVVGCVVPTAGAAGDAALARALDAFMQGTALARFKRPKAYVFLDTLPRNATNKVLRRVLRDQAATARGGGEGPQFFGIG